MSAPVQVWADRDGRLLRVRLAASILDIAAIQALDATLELRANAPGLRGILIDPAGAHFSFGASVEEHLPDRCAAMLAGLHGLILRIVRSPVPVLVAIRGQCLGAGLELAAAGHLLFAEPNAAFGQPEIRLGVFAPAASCLLPERIGLAAAEDLLLSGRSITGAEARALGLVNELADDCEAAALAYFDRHLADKSASSLRYAVRASRHDLAEQVAVKLAALETLYLSGLMTSHDGVEGLNAFMDKRAPQWKDR
jgi:cyclohexa-1,5-dienecarbonyl-CoA hydratase